MKKLVAAILGLVGRRAESEPDHFEVRLKSLTAPRRAPGRGQPSPHLFRREAQHA